MSRPRTYNRAATEADLPSLALPWAAYLTARRRAWVTAAHIERRYFRTQDYAAFVSEAQRFTQFVARATAAWTSAVRKVHSGALIEAVGDSGAAHMPPCFLVRVPKKGSIELQDHIFGAVRGRDQAGHERLRGVRHVEQKARAMAGARDVHDRLFARMQAALAGARERQAAQAKVLFEREQLEDTAEHQAQRRRLAVQSHAHGREVNRRWHIAKKYEARLKTLGYSYDLASVETP